MVKEKKSEWNELATGSASAVSAKELDEEEPLEVAGVPIAGGSLFPAAGDLGSGMSCGLSGRSAGFYRA